MRIGIIILASFGTMLAVAAIGDRVEAAGLWDHTARRTMSVTTASKSLSEAQTNARSQAEP